MAKEKLNSVFIHNPKTGGLTVEEVLKLDRYRYPHRVKLFPQTGHVTFGHQYYVNLRDRGDISDEFHNTAFKYGFVRNPYDRAVSHYFYVRKAHPNILPSNVSFLQFTRILERKHYTPQHIYFRDIDMDFIGRFETFDQDLKKIADILGIKIGEIIKKNAIRHEDYRSYYTSESKRNVLEFYKKDFELYGYDENDIVLH